MTVAFAFRFVVVFAVKAVVKLGGRSGGADSARSQRSQPFYPSSLCVLHALADSRDDAFVLASCRMCEYRCEEDWLGFRRYKGAARW